MKKIVSLLLAALLVFSLASCMGESPKEFTKDGMKITLTNQFTEATAEGYTVCYASDDVAVFVLKEPFTLQEGLADFSIDDYAALVYAANASKSPSEITKDGDLTVMEYSFLNEAENQTYSYYAAMFKSADAFWLVQFSCKQENYTTQKPLFVDWAKTVSFAS